MVGVYQSKNKYKGRDSSGVLLHMGYPGKHRDMASRMEQKWEARSPTRGYLSLERESTFITHLPRSALFIFHKVNLYTRDSLNVGDVQKMQLSS